MLINPKMSTTRTHLSIKSGAALAMAMSIVTPLSAQDTVVEGKAHPSDIVEARVGYTDLDLRNEQSQLLLISRVRKAAGSICNIINHGDRSIAQYSGCRRNIYLDAKPQIDSAIANAQNSSRVAINLVVSRKR